MSRKKLIFLLYVAIFICFFNLIDKQKAEGQLAQKRYSDPKGFFRVVPPDGWKIQDYPEDPRGKVAFIAPEREVEFRILASIKGFSSFEDLYQTTLENAKDIRNRFGINVDIQKTTFLGRQAIQRNWVWKDQKFFAIEFLDGNIRHDLQYGAPQRVYDRYLSIIMKSMETYEPLKSEKGGEISKEHAIANKLRLAELFFENGNYVLAMEYVKEGLEIDPGNPKLKELKVKIESVRQNKGDSEVHKKKGAEYVVTGQYDRAIDEFTKAIKINPNDPEAYIGRGFAYYKRDKHDEAIKDFNSAIKLDPKATDAFFNRGLCYVKKGEYKKAIEDFTKTIDLGPKNLSEVYNNRGLCYRKIGENEKAMRDYTKAIEIDPKNGEAYNNRGVLYMNLGDVKKAIADFKKASELGSERGRRNLERALQEQGR